MSQNWEANSLVGQNLGQFEIKAELGRGGMAVVYKGYQSSLDRWVAIKTLPSEMAGKRDLVSRFHREAEAMVSLNHSNIVQIIDKGQERGLYYFAMEFVDGPSLQDMLKQEQLSMDLMFDISIQVADGLNYAHKKGVVHRDIKPGNVFWENATSLAKVGDFGIARLTQKPEEMITLTATNVGMGTMNYMAPEQKTDAGSVDHRADIYSLGVMVYEMFTGKLPMGRFKMPSAINSSLPRKLDEIVTKCMEPDPVDRYESMELLKADLEAAREQAQGGGTLIRSVRDAAERTLTAVAGEQGGKKLGPACCLLFVLLGLGGGGAAYKFLVLDKQTDVASGKTTKTHKTSGTSGDGGNKTEDGDKTDETKTADGGKTDETKTEDGDKTDETKTEEKTGGGETKTEEKTGGGETKTEEKTGGSTTKTEVKTGGATKTGKTGNGGTKPVVNRIDPVLQRQVSKARALLKEDADRLAALAVTWQPLKGVQKAVSEARAARQKHTQVSRTSLRNLDFARDRLNRRGSNALYSRANSWIKDLGNSRRYELQQGAEKARSAFRQAGSSKPAARVLAYVKVLEGLLRTTAVSGQVRAEAAVQMVRMRAAEDSLRKIKQNIEEGRRKLASDAPKDALRLFNRALNGMRKLHPTPPSRMGWIGKHNVPKISGNPRRLTTFSSISPVPGRRFAAIAHDATQDSRLILYRLSGSRLVREYSTRVLRNGFHVATAGMNDRGHISFWVGTLSTHQTRIKLYRFNKSGVSQTTGISDIQPGEWIYDMVVGPEGRLYVLLEGQVRVYFNGKREHHVEYDSRAFTNEQTPRRVAVMADKRLVISGLAPGGSWRNEWKNKSSAWTFKLLQAHLGTRGSSAVALNAFSPGALTAIGNSLLCQEHGLVKKERHMKIFTRSLLKAPRTLTSDISKGKRAAFALDMAYSDGICFVLDAVVPPRKRVSRNRIIVFRKD